MACNILMYAFQEDDQWPEAFVRVYVEDALGDRIWVDNEHCRSFIDNILTAFGTKMPSHNQQTETILGKTTLPTEQPPTVAAVTLSGSSSSSASSTPLGAGTSTKEDEDVVLEELETASSVEDESNVVTQRFDDLCHKLNLQ